MFPPSIDLGIFSRVGIIYSLLSVVVLPSSAHAATLRRVEIEDTSIVTRSKGWTDFFGYVLSNDQGLESDYNRVAYLDFSFEGTSLAIVHGKGPNRGKFSVSINSKKPTIVNSYDQEFSFQNSTVIAESLPSKSHNVTLTSLTKISAIDAFDFKPVPEPLTIFGSGLALVFGFMFKKQYFKRKK